MFLKPCLALSVLLLLNYVTGRRVYRNAEDVNSTPVEESDIKLVEETGCKFLSLANDESKLFKKDTGNLEHTTISLPSEEASEKPKFALNFAVKSPSDFVILMFTRQQYENISKTSADYDLTLGTGENKFSQFHYTAFNGRYQNYQSIDLRNTSQILSSDKYENFYITLEDGVLKCGKQCQPEPIYNTSRLGFYRPEIVQIGFKSKSEHGAKILYDCPSNFASC